MFRLLLIASLTLTATSVCFAGEYAVLTSGMVLHVDRHEESDGLVRLYRGQAVTEIPRVAVASFEPEEPQSSASTATAPAASPAPIITAEPAPVPAAPAASDSKPPDPRELVRAAATRAGLPPAFVESVAKAESGFDPSAVSPKGAVGVMQLMPATAKALGADPRDPAQNIEAGARLLRDLLIKYDGDVAKALAAYNAGETAVDRYQGVPPYQETQHYVNTVVRDYLKTSAQ